MMLILEKYTSDGNFINRIVFSETTEDNAAEAANRIVGDRVINGHPIVSQQVCDESRRWTVVFSDVSFTFLIAECIRSTV